MSLITRDTPSDQSGGNTRIVGVRLGAIGAGLVGLYLLYQLVWALVSLTVGIAIVGVVGTALVAGAYALPTIFQKWENRLLGFRKAEARKNPIEQAQNEYLRRSEQYQLYKEAVENIGGQVASFGSMIAKTRQEQPAYDLAEEIAAHEKMKLFYENRKQRMREAGVKLAAFKAKIGQAQTKWEFQLAANATFRALNATDRESKINEILTEISFDSVQKEFDIIFARLDVDAAEFNNTNQLTFGGDQAVLDVSNINVPQLEKVGK